MRQFHPITSESRYWTPDCTADCQEDGRVAVHQHKMYCQVQNEDKQLVAITLAEVTDGA